tara:strand:+ start:232 stop:633 length:402 start_codon:yes stop_codon:yes gene_type:complete
MAAVSSIHNGWRWDPANTRLDFYYRGTRVGHINATAFNTTQGITADTGGVTATAGDVTSTAANVVATAGDVRATVGNYRAGPVNAFATTEPTQAAVYEAGTPPAGAVTTSSAVWSSATVLRKLDADGTASNVG